MPHRHLRQFTRLLLLSSAMVATTASPARAEFDARIYGGANWDFSSKVKLNKGGIHDARTINWEGKPFEPPPYWGARFTYWMNETPEWGVAFDYTHSKAYADINTATDPIYSHLQFTDGNNIFTLNLLYRYQQKDCPWTWYIGGGPGIAVPDSEVRLKAFPTQETDEYEFTGLAAQVLVGGEYRFNQHWGAFAEGKLSYTNDNSDLNGGGTLKTEIIAPHALTGVSYHF